MDLNNQQLKSPFQFQQSNKCIAEEVGLPAWVNRALLSEVISQIQPHRDWGLPEHEKACEKELNEKLRKELSDDQLNQVKVLHDLMLRKSHYAKEYMFYSGVKQGIRFHKEFQSIYEQFDS